MGMDAADLAAMRVTVNALLPDMATIARTGLTVKCRVDDGTRDERLPGFLSFIRLRRWLLIMPDAQDVRGGDAITVPGKGTYYVMDTANPTSFSASTAAYCVMTSDAAGTVAFPSNQTVTFSDPKDNARVTAATPVLIEWITDQQRADGVEGDWRVYWPETLRYPDGTQVGYNHEINWSRSPNPLPGGAATLGKPVHPFPGILLLVMATFVEAR